MLPELARHIRPGDGIVVGQACAEPLTLMEALVAQRASFSGASVFLGVNYAGIVKREHADKRVLAVLKIFVGMLVFNKSCRRHVKGLARDVARGMAVPKLQRQETDLYMNPRRVR